MNLIPKITITFNRSVVLKVVSSGFLIKISTHCYFPMRAACLTRLLVHDLIIQLTSGEGLHTKKPIFMQFPPASVATNANNTASSCLALPQYTRGTLMTAYTLNYVTRRWLISKTFPCLSRWQRRVLRWKHRQLPLICRYITDDLNLENSRKL